MKKKILNICFLCFCTLSLSQTFQRIENNANFDFLRNINGVAVADYDQDNDLDIFVVAKNDFSQIEQSSWSRLFRNNNDGTFEDMTLAAGFDNLHNRDLEDPGWELGVKMGASWGDYDNDGFPDLFLTNYQSFQLFHNEGDGTFKEVTEAAGLPKTDSCYNYTALWWDLDRDGHLDLFVPNWLGCTRNKFYHNNGDGTFTEKAEELNLVGTKEGSLMAAPIDANNDGLWDIYLTNDGSENELFIQNLDGTFSEKAAEYLIDFNGNEKSITIGDYNNDGNFELFVSNISENRLLVPTGNNSYENLAEEKNILNTFWAWDSRFSDFDLDGDEDLFVINGYESDQIFHPTEKENFYFKNLHTEGQDTFEDWSVQAEIDEFSNSISMAVFDYDNDGDQDVFISNTNDTPCFYENKITFEDITNEPDWVNIRLQGTISNRDAMGSTVKVWKNGKMQQRLHYGASFMGQSLQAVHFGFGNTNTFVFDSLEIIWNSGIQEKYFDLPLKKHFHFIENQGYEILELKHEKIYGCTDPNSCSYDPEATVDIGTCTYLPPVEIIGNSTSGYFKTEIYTCPENAGSTYHWSVEDGEILAGQGTARVTIQWHLADIGTIKVKEINSCESEISELKVDLSLAEMSEGHSIARLWNEVLLFSIRNDFARPTVHARNLFHHSIAMYDAWAIYDAEARPYLIGNNVNGFQSDFDGFTTTKNLTEAQKETISFAAYRILFHRFLQSPAFVVAKDVYNGLMEELGYDRFNTATDYSTGDSAALGNYIAQQIIEYGMQDGATELQDYANAYYQPINPPLITNHNDGTNLLDPNRWQPLQFETFIDQSGNVIEGSTPDFLSPEWGNVHAFSLNNNVRSTFEKNGDTYHVFHDPSQPPYLDTLNSTAESQLYQWNFSLVSIWASHLDPNDGVLWDISPAGIGNINLSEFPRNFADYANFYNTFEGGDIGEGWNINPTTGQPYPPQIVPRGDYTRVLAEFWADGPDSETPPGHWFTILNKVNDHPLLEKRLGGKGQILSSLEWDVKSYFILGGTMHDAAVTAWSVKGWYDYIRPISAIRYLAERGQSSDPNLPNYDLAGIPLEEGFVELIKAGDPLAGASNQNIGKIKLYTWLGHRFITDTETEIAGVGWILAEDWMPYQRISFVTPPFAGYVSGHSTFSRAAAEAMTLLTGDAYFPGGVGEFVAYKNEFLVFEEGPSQDVILQWATYRDASDQCSLSRIWGGIHPPADDINGRLMGEKIGKEAFAFAVPYFSSEDNSTENKNLILYPNPISSNETLTLTNTTEDMTFRLFNARGQEMTIQSVNFNVVFGCTEIEIGKVSAGVYFVHSDEQVWKVVVN